MDQRWNVIAWNQAACVILGDFSAMNARERNVVWGMFTEPKYKQLYVDWQLHAKELLGRFRATCGQYIEDAWLARFIDELKGQSAEFNAWWSLHEIQSNGDKCKQLAHPVAGRLDFEASNFEVPDNSGLKMIVHTPLSGTDTAAKMQFLITPAPTAFSSAAAAPRLPSR